MRLKFEVAHAVFDPPQGHPPPPPPALAGGEVGGGDPGGNLETLTRPGGLDSPGVADPVRSGWPVPRLLGISR